MTRTKHSEGSLCEPSKTECNPIKQFIYLFMNGSGCAAVQILIQRGLSLSLIVLNGMWNNINTAAFINEH